jgi:hypothetical protein
MRITPGFFGVVPLVAADELLAEVEAAGDEVALELPGCEFEAIDDDALIP